MFLQNRFRKEKIFDLKETRFKNAFDVYQVRQQSTCNNFRPKISLSIFFVSVSMFFSSLGVDARSNLKQRDDNDTETEEEEIFWGQDLELSPTTWIILVSSVVAFWILLATFLACFCGPNFVECQLCEQQVSRNQWNRLDHREGCAKDHERFLSELNRIEVRCPRCSTKLYQWPKLGPKTFRCLAGLACQRVPTNKLAMSRKRWKQRVKVDIGDKEKNVDEDEMMPGGGPEPVEVENTGSNRLCCFLCDFNICDKCIGFIESAESSNASVMGSTLALPTKKQILPEGKKPGRRKNSASWNEATIKTISRQVDISHLAGTTKNGSLANGITQVRPP